jgi:type VI secretion system protein ImpI
MREIAGQADAVPRPESFVKPAAASWQPSSSGPHLGRGSHPAPSPSYPFPPLEPVPAAPVRSAHELPEAPAAAALGPARPAGPGGAEMAGARGILEAIGAAAGLPPGTLTANGDPGATATEIGQALRVVAEDLSALLQMRAMVRRTTRTARQTMIERDNNNPMKFMPTPDEALGAMFGTPRPGYQRGATAIRAGFADLKRHQYASQAAIPKALERLLEDLAPEAVERRLGGGGLFGRKARAWETYVERWDAKVQAHDNGMLDVFMAFFADAYDQQERG